MKQIKLTWFQVKLRQFQSLKQRSVKTFALLFAVGFSLNFAISACSLGNSATFASMPSFSIGQDPNKVVRIGHQKFGSMSLLRAKGDLEKRLNSMGLSVRWNQFPAGPQLLEALNAGQLDLGHTGETPPISAQAAGAPLLYVATSPPNPKGEAILVPKDSPIRNIADLKGKKVAMNKGSNVHYLVVKALEKAKLNYTDIEPVFIPPADARAAFEKKEVDAWAIWDPYFASAEQATGARILTDATDIVDNREYIFASQSFAKQHPDRLKIVLEEVKKIDRWAKEKPREVAEILSPLIGIDANVLEKVAKRRAYGVEPITEEIVAYQQKLADTFHRLKLVPKKIDVGKVALVSQQENKQLN
ncbi:MAG: putative aliphatic sulfonates-binding protein [Chroococcidiopsis cubana SAG 39.79]|nr:sulfonate ABC transporter substrate-binding protein [Chroococcidiopsis cubana]MDZ4876621.1 putative aliphatic sulfonates-binding protein [Chroococcidiopsis cubana SAG 39.79]PSB62904.1 sulfonate ABC transporter substrate-binding protein [Chroococcidiopsis cubana CCALA 043]